MISPTSRDTLYVNAQKNITEESGIKNNDQHLPDINMESHSCQESLSRINSEGLTPNEQREYFQQLRRIQLAQIGQIHHAYHLDHENGQQQAAAALKAHEEFQQMMKVILLAQSNPIPIPTRIDVPCYVQGVLPNLANCASTVTQLPEKSVPLESAPTTTVVGSFANALTSSEWLSSAQCSNIGDEEIEQQENIVKVPENENTKEKSPAPVEKAVLPSMLATQGPHEDELYKNNSEANTVNVQLWQQSVKEWETSSEKLERDAKHRLVFERAFTELRKFRTRKERFSKEKRKVTAPSGFLAIAQRDEEKKLLNVAPIPAFSPNVEVFGNICFDRVNNIADALHDNKTMIDHARSKWTDKEIAIFLNKYREVGKNLPFIAEFLPDKVCFNFFTASIVSFPNVSDCVLFYYLSKSVYEFKSIHRKKRKAAKFYQPLPMPTLEEVDKFQLISTPAEDDGSNMNCLEILCREVERMKQM